MAFRKTYLGPSVRVGTMSITTRKEEPHKDDKKSLSGENEELGLRPEELALPEKAADPHGMAFSESELEALCDTDNEEAKALALATASPAKRALMQAKKSE